MIKIIVLSAVLALTGCGATDRLGASITGYSQSCVEGVSYLQFASGVTVQYNPDGTVVKCVK